MRNGLHIGLAGAAIGLCMACGTPGRAADAVAPPPPAAAPSTGWVVTGAPYLWAAGLEGSIGQFGLQPIAVDASFADIMKNFDIGLMGAAEARYGRLGIATDLQYIRVSTDADTPRGLLADSVEVTSTTFSLFGAGMYRLLETEKGSLDAMAGARLWAVKTVVDPVGGPLDRFEFTESQTWVDPVVGLKGRYNLPADFYLTGWGMIGGFGAASQTTWDVMGALGYEVTDSVSLIAGYRALSVDYSDGDFVFDVVEKGPLLGATIKF